VRQRVLGSLLGAVLLAAGASGASAPARERPADPAARAVEHEVAELRRERELASGKGFYLRLDATRKRLALVLQGVTLDDYGVSGLELGVPEVLFVNRHPPADWDVRAIGGGRLDPERQHDRVEIVAPAPGSGDARAASEPPPSPPEIPKSAEELISVPSPYRIVFAEGVSLEVRAGGAGGRNRSWLRRVLDAAGLRASDLGSALGVGTHDRVRLRVTLEAEDAASLYRSLPPDVGLIVVGLPPG